jgi:MinD-like ATPase involved in chromosome partitioning or flagellar assembly
MPAMIRQLLPVLPTALFGSTPASVDRLSTAHGTLRSPVTTSRRIGFVSVSGGSGCSVTAGAVASVFASRRTGRMLGVDAGGGSRGFGWHLAIPGGERITPSAPSGFAPTRSWDATEGLPRAGTGLYYLGANIGHGSAPDHEPFAPSVTEWSSRVAPIGRFFDIVVTDWGTRDWRLDLVLTADVGHTLCLVTRADRESIEETASVIPGLKERTDARILLTIVDVDGIGVRAENPHLRPLGVPVLRIPFDRARASDSPAGSRALRPATRIAQAELAAEVLAAATSPARRAAQP